MSKLAVIVDGTLNLAAATRRARMTGTGFRVSALLSTTSLVACVSWPGREICERTHLVCF